MVFLKQPLLKTEGPLKQHETPFLQRPIGADRIRDAAAEAVIAGSTARQFTIRLGAERIGQTALARTTPSPPPRRGLPARAPLDGLIEDTSRVILPAFFWRMPDFLSGPGHLRPTALRMCERKRHHSIRCLGKGDKTAGIAKLGFLTWILTKE